jgi:hypothetical protein
MTNPTHFPSASKFTGTLYRINLSVNIDARLPQRPASLTVYSFAKWRDFQRPAVHALLLVVGPAQQGAIGRSESSCRQR